MSYSTGRFIYTLYLMSDGYIGFDQQYNIQLDVVGQEPFVPLDKLY